VTCPAAYTNTHGYEQPNAPPDAALGAQDPYGTGGQSYVLYGTCPIDKPFDKNDDAAMKKIAMAMLNAYDSASHGHFFWNFRTELEDRWSYAGATEKGWLPTGEEYKTKAFRHKVRLQNDCEVFCKAISKRLWNDSVCKAIAKQL
jgi:hypothetical protein